MPYLVNTTGDALRVPELGRVIPAGGSTKDLGLELSPDDAARYAQNAALSAFADDGTPIAPLETDWSPKKIDLSWMTEDAPASPPDEAPAAPETTPAPKATPEQVTVEVPAGEHVEVVPDDQAQEAGK